MNNRIDTVNGKEVANFVKNTDYFEMSDGVFWTVDALMKKYDIGKSTLYNKARDYNISTMKVLGIVCFKEDDRFNKIKPDRIKNLEGHKLISYAELYRKIEELINTVRSATIPDGNTQSLPLEMQELQQSIMSINTRTFEHTAEIASLTNQVKAIYDSCFRQEKMVYDILNYLTKEKEK